MRQPPARLHLRHIEEIRDQGPTGASRQNGHFAAHLRKVTGEITRLYSAGSGICGRRRLGH